MPSRPKKACLSTTPVFGQDLLNLDYNYYFGQMKFILQHQPNLAGKALDDEEAINLLRRSMWKCGGNDWIAFLMYCSEDVPIDLEERPICRGPTPNVPLATSSVYM